MRHGATGRRSRNRGNGGRRGGGGNVQVFDSNGPDVRIRGTAHQIYEKYMTLAKDAGGSGDYILAESYHQHAEHYQRIISGWHETVKSEGFANAADDDRNDQRRSRYNRGNNKPQQQKKDEDLGLPSSITGKEKQAQKDGALEDA